jgi:hypothetical protein
MKEESKLKTEEKSGVLLKWWVFRVWKGGARRWKGQKKVGELEKRFWS